MTLGTTWISEIQPQSAFRKACGALPLRRRVRSTLAAGSLLLLAFLAPIPAAAGADPAEPAPARVYPSGWSSVSKLAFDIHKSLKPEHRDLVHTQPVSLETDVKPFVKLEEYADEKKPMPVIFISLGFVDLINNLSHAKAISLKEKKYFLNYIETLAGETGAAQLTDLPGVEKEAYWSEAMMNEQLSNFNSIAGILVSINFAHHYLGQFKKYEKQIMDTNGNSVPINKVLAPDEYEKAFAAGIRTALEAGIFVEGVTSFFEAFDKMKVRPEWAVYFIPEQVKFAKLKKTMSKIQSDFLAGKN